MSIHGIVGTKRPSLTHLRGQDLRHIATIAGGAALGQLILLVATPLLSRAYTPTDFGQYSTFVAICNVFITSACLKYDTALSAADDNQSELLFGAACIAAITTAAVAFAFASSQVGSSTIQAMVNHKVSACWFGAAAACCGAYQATTAMAIRRGRYGWSSLLRAGQPALLSIAALTLPVGLIVCCILSYLIALPLAIKLGTDVVRRQGDQILRAAWRYRQFPIVSLPTSILDAISVAVPIWFISAQYSSADAGNYAQVQRVITAPLILFALAIGQLYWGRSGDLVRNGQSAQLLQRQVVICLAIVAILLATAIWLFFSPLLVVFLGETWRTDPAFLLLVYAPIAVRSCVSPVTSIFIVRNKLRICAVWQLAYGAVTIGMFCSLAGRVSFEDILAAYALTECASYGLYLYLADRVAR